MLLDGAIRFCSQARTGVEAGDADASYAGFTQARDIIAELITCIGPEAPLELADNVRAVMSFIYRELIEASLERDAARVARVIEILEYERDTWQLFIERLQAERSGDPMPAVPEAAPRPHDAAVASHAARQNPVARIHGFRPPDGGSLPSLSLSA